MREWIDADQVDLSELPDWARRGHGSGPRVTLHEEGIALVHEGRGSWARWRDVFGVVLPTRFDLPAERAFVLVPRRPPHKPWLEVTASMLPPELREVGLAGFQMEVRRRSDLSGYRDGPETRPGMEADALLSRVLEGEPIPGAVEVPITVGKKLTVPHRMVLAVAFGLVSAVVGVHVGLFLGIVTEIVMGDFQRDGWIPIFVMAAMGLLCGLSAALWAFRHDRREPDPSKRVLLLSPDGCVCGFRSGVRAFTWKTVSGFGLVPSPSGAGLEAVAVCGADGRPLGFIDTHWFDVPADVVVHVADAYRSRQA